MGTIYKALEKFKKTSQEVAKGDDARSSMEFKSNSIRYNNAQSFQDRLAHPEEYIVNFQKPLVNKFR